jgi:sugar O-acyltransferase (sialic acid O-acetyltransferase NeuD family)
MTTRLVIVGARDHARLVHDAVLAVNENRPTFAFEGFIAHGTTRPDVIEKRGARILGGLEYFESCDPDIAFIVGLGSPEDRRAVDRELSEKGFASASVIHPTALISPFAGDIGEGCYIGPFTSIQTEATLERHVHVGAHVNVGHDNTLDSYTTLSPGVMSSGHVFYGEGVMVGANAAFLPKINVGEWSTVGAGAMVSRDVSRGTTVVGVPAEAIPGRISAQIKR